MGAFLEPAPGDASLCLLKMLREGLLYGLRLPMHTARKTNQPVRVDGLRIKHGDSAASPANMASPHVVGSGTAAATPRASQFDLCG